MNAVNFPHFHQVLVEIRSLGAPDYQRNRVQGTALQPPLTVVSVRGVSSLRGALMVAAFSISFRLYPVSDFRDTPA